MTLNSSPKQCFSKCNLLSIISFHFLVWCIQTKSYFPFIYAFILFSSPTTSVPTDWMQGMLVCKETRQVSIESEKLFDIQNKNNLEDYIFITSCHLMFLVLAGRNETQLWQSIGVLLISKTWITVSRVVPLTLYKALGNIVVSIIEL